LIADGCSGDASVVKVCALAAATTAALAQPTTELEPMKSVAMSIKGNNATSRNTKRATGNSDVALPLVPLASLIIIVNF
jgi:hypothetical protein